MKKLLFSALACAMLLPAVTVQAGGKITWEGRKTNIFGQCVGDAVTVCKEVIINDGGDGRLDPTFPPGDDITIGGGEYIGIGIGDDDPYVKVKSMSDDTQVTVVFDGMYYECPASWVNWEDGSITPR